ncbi:BRCA1-A complex subunit Abraxas 1-like [Amphibalanus amphitrite]|uniref:BRCA1-A complex subunit Abraxas 1-like n=1 Tax=Amphibalanus amphitrite TaxID=1232801 RepID=UPI001C8FE689|nr:BRCA1-A complex subunit Abraxas 1-like [Amphibalanus amphitrite]XP_043211714.1 BRCA1-A complex subunit Abraxas 1-like [Amphibalanus amphitrite]XP_043211715.1 BRCA1-A complex subunit Abraxas 1-like [Amphibalanus amphitrite]XP_043211716.1 BRCA1-A complex subunit Abraxas 1-like [Amphibalanus amphitrite]XP_043211717.1 BRCA1-A complex subunit Abraxas 1-like [Amphibalanus amphitrite]XP_043211718.1 BRCA1-A complex subunit Abraxas 1-like [Amphibalanus amphitrite]XP_043211719.1 BRCA1-A complex subu
MTSDTFHDTVVVMTGTLLSSLLADNLQPGSDKEGFLLGKTVVQTVQVNNDVQSDIPLEQTRIVLSDFLSCGRTGEFYSNTGRLDNEKLTSLFDDPDLVVGWYRYRRACPCCPSLRERAVHAELCHRRRKATQKTGFVFLLMTDNVVEKVLRHEQEAFVLRDRVLAPIRLEVANLGAPGGGRYRTTPFGQLGPLLPGAAGPTGDSGALSAALAVQSSAAEQLRALAGRLERSERDTAAAYREIEELKLRLADRRVAGR